MKILYIPDIHVKRGVSNERLTWAGNLIVVEQPDVIVQAGDFADMESLSHWEYGKMSSEGKRYQDDIEAVIEAQELLFEPLESYNKGRKKKYNPRRCITLGNHEYRIDKERDVNAKLSDTISTKDLMFEEFGWEVTPFKQVLTIEGINFSHYFPNGLMDKAVSGQNIGRTLLTNNARTSIQGHNHVFNYSTNVDLDGNRMHGISAGCYFEHEEHYVSKTIQRTWWRGVVMLDNVTNGDFDLRQIRMSTIKELYR